MAQNIEMQCKQSDGSYETLLPKSQASLLEINNTDLGNHLGGNTTVEGSLDYLSRMYAYWWKREIRIPTYTISRDRVAWLRLGYSYGTMYHYNSTQYLTIYPKVGNTLNTTSNGTVYIVDQKNFTVQLVWERDKVYPQPTISGGGLSGTTTDSHQVSGKYWNIDGAICCNDSQSDQILDIAVTDGTPATAKFWVGSKERTLYKMVSSVSGYTDGGTDYVYSFSRDTYPDSGTVGNYTYTYLGIPFENAMKDGPK